METIEKFICRLCLKICGDGFEVIEDTVQEMLYFLLLNLNLAVSNEPVVCNSCLDNLKECRNFKLGYLYREDMRTFAFHNMKQTSSKIYLDKYKNFEASCSSSTSITCYFCADVVNGESSMFIKNKEANLTAMLEKYCPELILKINDELTTCILCHEALQRYITSMTNWLSVEEKINECCKVEGTNNNGQIELNSVLQFTSKNIFCNENTYSSLNAVKIEEYLDQTKNEGVDIGVNNEDCMGTEKEELYFRENDMKLKIEENIYDSSGTKGEMPVHIGLNNKDCVRKEIEEIDFRKNNIETSYQEDLSCIQHLEEIPTETNKNDEELKKRKCRICAFVFTRKSNLIRHMRLHKNISEVTMHSCDICGYRTRHKNNLKDHLNIHKDNTEVTMYKCNNCAHQTRHKSSLRVHMLVHMNTTETTVYKCNSCEYESKHKDVLKTHELLHKSASQVRMYRCNNCSFQGKLRSYLTKHMLTHKSASEVKLYECEFCMFKSKHRKSLGRHMLTHKDRSEITMHKCKFCPFRTKYKDNLHKHEKNHRSTSEVTARQK